MTAVSGGMKTSDMGRDAMRQGASEWAGIGWADSSWELARGLDVVENLPLEAWPMEPEGVTPRVPALQTN